MRKLLDSLGGLDKLLDGSYSKSDVEQGLRALIWYSKSGAFSSSASDKYILAFRKTISGTDNKHPKYGGTASGSLAYLWQNSKRAENDSKPTGYFRLFYSNVYGNSLSNYGSSVVNREHVWPQSLSGGLFGTTGGGAYLHHVRPCNGKLNSNYDGELTGYASSSCFEPTDDYKGDIARIFAYLIVHYPSLENLLNNVLIGGTKTLVAWNKLDSVDFYEIQRNNVAYDYQGNRNPFIYAPGLIDEICGDGQVAGGETPDVHVIPKTPSISSEYKLVSNDNTTSDIVKGKNVNLSNGSIITNDDSIKWVVNRTSNGISLASKESKYDYISCPSISGTKLTLSKTPTIFSAGNYSLINLGGSSYASTMNIYIKTS